MMHSPLNHVVAVVEILIAAKQIRSAKLTRNNCFLISLALSYFLYHE